MEGISRLYVLKLSGLSTVALVRKARVYEGLISRFGKWRCGGNPHTPKQQQVGMMEARLREIEEEIDKRYWEFKHSLSGRRRGGRES